MELTMVSEGQRHRFVSSGATWRVMDVTKHGAANLLHEDPNITANSTAIDANG